MRAGALQPGYLPWLGYFDQIDRSDVFVLYDDLPFQRHAWLNRNRIRAADGWRWLTVPVVHRRLGETAIREVEISGDHDWRRVHWKTIRTCYGRAPYFADHEAFFAEIYGRPWRYLIDVDLAIISYLVGVLGIETKLVLSSEAGLEREYLAASDGKSDPTGRVAFICRRLGAERFLEGALGRSYMDPARAARLGVTLEFHDYPHPTYRQLFRPFVPYLSVIDLLFNHGPDSREILTGRRAVEPRLEQTRPNAS